MLNKLFNLFNKNEYEFDLNKQYIKIMTKRKLVKLIKKCYDKKFEVYFIPRAKDNADIIIRSCQDELIKSKGYLGD